MSDEQGSGGIIGTIISALILVAIWPYLMALFGIYIAYIIAMVILEWLATHWIFSLTCTASLLMVYLVLRFRLIQRGIQRIQQSRNIVGANELSVNPELRPVSRFIPSTNLYCYWCTKKLGLQAHEYQGKFYCDSCNKKLPHH